MNDPQEIELNRVRETFGSFYLTLISIIQGFAFGYLVVFVFSEDKYKNFGFTAWLLSFIVLGIIIGTWDEYAIGVMLFVWIPNIIDSILPFLLGIFQIMLINSISNKPQTWFIFMACCAFVQFCVFLNAYFKAKTDPVNNPIFLHGIGIYKQIAFIYALSSTIILLVIGLVVIFIPIKDVIYPFMSIFAAFILGGFIFIDIRVWDKVVKYIRPARKQIQLTG